MRPPIVSGPVIHGQGLGRKLGFPTANIKLRAKDIPPFGVYRVKVWLPQPRLAVCSVGRRPTITGSKGVHVEVHIPRFSGDLYGKTLTMSFLNKIRDEKKFSSLDELLDAIREDIKTLRR